METNAAPPHQALEFNRELVRRYDLNGPRYTSYPTVLQFHERFGEPEYKRAIESSNEDPIPRPLSLYLHVPFCARPCFYCGCTKVITRQSERADEYLARLEREIGQVAGLLDSDRLVKQVHFGGGTPTFIPPERLDALLGSMAGRFSFSAGLECAIEIDPRTVSPAQVEQLARSGFNRMSLGVQDFDHAVQAAVNRVQAPDRTLAIMETAARACPLGINVDLIYGLPKQTLSSFARTLDILVQARPNRVAAYSYAHMPHLFKPQKQIRAEDLPGPDQKLALLELTVERLTAAGYVYIGMDHFALPGDELVRAMEAGRLQRNFQGYSWQPECDTLGFGMSAISDVGGIFSQNHKEIVSYQAQVDRGALPIWRGYEPSFDDRLRRAVIHDIMCRGSVEFGAIEERFELDFSGYFSTELARLRELEADGLLAVDADGFHLTPPGRLLLRAVAMVFDAYLTAAPARPRFSRVV